MEFSFFYYADKKNALISICKTFQTTITYDKTNLDDENRCLQVRRFSTEVPRRPGRQQTVIRTQRNAADA